MQAGGIFILGGYILFDKLTLTELRDAWIYTRLLGRMDNKKLRAYARALDPMMRELGQYRVEWLTVSDFIQIIEAAKASSKNYQHRKMGALRYFFAFLHELGLIDVTDLATLCSASYLTPESMVKGGEKNGNI